jgi:hypothetical protein
MMRNPLVHLIVERLGRGDKKAPRAWCLMCKLQRVRAFAAARPSGYQRNDTHSLAPAEHSTLAEPRDHRDPPDARIASDRRSASRHVRAV